MTGLGSSEIKTVVDSELAVGHLAFRVADLKYRLELINRGIAVGEIPDETFFGHHLFCVKDPDGNGITIYTSHAIQ